MGGNTDNGDDKWRLSITRLTELGQSPSNNVFALNQEKWEGSDNDAPFIDHMHLDDTSDPGKEWMFGSSRSRDEDITGDFTYLWKVKLDANHNPNSATVIIHQVSGDFKDEGHMIAIKPNLVNGKVHALFWRKEKQIHYF